MKYCSNFKIIPLLFLLSLTTTYCQKAKNYVEINGKKYTEEDIQREMPQVYNKYKARQLNELKKVFSQFADKKIIEEAAKKQNIKPEEVLTKGMPKEEPSKEDIQEFYDRYKGQLKDKTFEELQPEIRKYLSLEREESFKETAKNKLREDFKVSFQMEEIKKERINVAENGNPSTGPKDAKITIIEFSDFDCPFCKRSQGVNQKLREKYKDKIRWVFRDYPLPFHPNAMFAHVAANCAIPQNKYWEYFKIIFEHSGSLEKENVIELAGKAGLDMEKFNKCIENDAPIQAEIQKDIADGQSVGVNGTPMFFINGITVEGAQPIEAFESIIEEELKK
ncbi:MAG: thioredoxin domain-containing protein [Leptospiraceae bacterium]|nr:thioredoxin domain-containing protein [Leptospiraceae bacterium]MCP5495072.1 thioredoxin domain-containing protein [Leptospiraceae bacterium]